MQLALEIAKLELKSRDELQTLWREYFKTDCNVQNREFYIARIAHRMQELAYGGLSTPKKEMITKIGVAIKKKGPPSGTRIIREYKGIEYSVRILDDGFEYNGMNYKSLSSLAFKITGQRISGNRFFGIGA